MTQRTITCALALAVGMSCDAASDRDPELSPDAAVSGSDEVVGTFNLSLVAPSDSDPQGHTSLVGKVYDGSAPSQLVWEVAAEDVDCRLLTPRAPFCPDRCGANAVCVEDGICQNYPKALTAGSVRVSGVHTSSGATEFTMDPIANTYQPRAAVKLPYPAFDEGERVRLRASGGADLEAFELEARGIAPLALTTDDFNLRPDRAFDLAWAKAAKPAESRVHVKLDISHHGGSKGVIACDFEDDGSAQLSATLVAKLLELGVAGYPSVIATRASSGSTRTRAGQVVLAIDSKVERFVTIEGVQSCTSDAECPKEKSCQADLTCR